MIPSLLRDVHFFFQMMQLLVHMLDLVAQVAPIVVLFAAPETPVQLPCFGAKMAIFLPHVPVGAAALHLALHMVEHAVQMIEFVAEPVVTTLKTVIAIVSLIVGTPFFFFMRDSIAAAANEHANGQSESDQFVLHMLLLFIKDENCGCAFIFS